MQSSEALGKEKVPKLLWQFSVPAIVGMLVNALYNVVDSAFVGNWVGDIGLTAVTIAFPIMLLLMGFGMLIGIGSATLVSIRMGEQKKAEAEKILGNALMLMIIMVVVMTTLALMFLEPILALLGADAEVMPYAKQFTSIILLGSVFMHIGFGINNIIRAEGNPRIAMTTMLISALVNIVLNPVFILLFDMGIRGSALATVMSQAVSAFWVLAHFLGEKSILKLRRETLTLDMSVAKEIIKIGMPPFLMQIAASGIVVLFNFNLIAYGGTLAVAAFGVINRVVMLILMPIFGINQGAQPIIGYNYGAKNYGRVMDALKFSVYAASAVAVVGFIVVQLFDVYILRVFNNNPELIQMGAYGLRISMLMLPILGFQIVCSNYFQAIGKAGHAIFLSLTRQVLMLIPAVIILPRFFGLTGIWLANPVSDFISALITGIYILFEIRRLKLSGV